MSRCPYCRRELTGFETLCKDCFEAGYDRIVHPVPWWQRIRPTYDSLYEFLFVFGYLYLLLRINRDNRPTMTGLIVLALLFAVFTILIGFATRDSSKPKVTLRQAIHVFFVFFVYFFKQIWVFSTYHPLDRPALFAVVGATIAGFSASISDPVKTKEQQKKAPE
jgi:hypothetical protein